MGSVHPPRGALVYPVGSKTSILEAIDRLRDNQTLWLEQGRHKWEEVRKNSKEQAVEYEDQRMRALTDWEYEPMDDRLAGRAIYDDFRKTYHSLDPIRVTHLPSIFSDTTWREILPRVESIDPKRFLHVQRHNTHIRGAPAPNASSQFPIRQTFPLTITRGQWLLAANSSGTLEDVLCVFYRPFFDAGEQCIRILGGPWDMMYCGVRCGGGQCVVCEERSILVMGRCSVGGMGKMLCAKDEGKIFATDGIVVMHNSSASLDACCLEQTGMLKGAALRAVDAGRVQVCDTAFRNIRMCALSVCGRGRVDAKRCVFRDLSGAAFAAGPRAMDAERLAAPTGPGHADVRERVFGWNRGTRSRWWVNQGGTDSHTQAGDESLIHDGPSNEEDEEEFGWLLGEGIAPPPAARAWGTEMLLQDCKVYGEAWPNITRPGILREGGNRYYAPKPLLSG